MKAFSRDTLITLLLAVLIFFGLQTTIQNFKVDGPSMNPNFQDGQLLLANKVVYKLHEPERGDVIIFRPPDNLRGDYIKRIIGLPGEVVEIKGGIVYIHKGDGEAFPLDEPYITARAKFPFEGDKIPENEYFVLGDNRNNSSDSRQGWTLPRQNIIGKAWFSIWPTEKWGLAANYSHKGE
ncbi:signal peptidase I [Chloroflexota bacterium]